METKKGKYLEWKPFLFIKYIIKIAASPRNKNNIFNKCFLRNERKSWIFSTFLCLIEIQKILTTVTLSKMAGR